MQFVKKENAKKMKNRRNSIEIRKYTFSSDSNGFLFVSVWVFFLFKLYNYIDFKR